MIFFLTQKSSSWLEFRRLKPMFQSWKWQLSPKDILTKQTNQFLRFSVGSAERWLMSTFGSGAPPS